MTGLCQNTVPVITFRLMAFFKYHATPHSSLHNAKPYFAVLVCAVCILWPLLSDAMSLGRSRGAAVLGRGMDITALVSMEPQEPTPEASCFSAEVFYGETRIGSQNVSISTARTSPNEMTVRVRASTLIDEPFVTLYVRAGCGQTLARRYVLLADSPSESASVGQSTVVPFITAPTASPVPIERPANNTVITESQTDGATASRQARQAQRREAAASRRAQQAAQAPANPADIAATKARRETRAAARLAAKQTQRERATQVEQERQQARAAQRQQIAQNASSSKISPRLKIDLLDFSPVREPTLRASNELLTQPTTDMQARAQAAAMWRSLNSSPEDASKDNLRLKAIEADVRTMSDITKQQTQELTGLRSDLQQAQRARYANPLVFGLGALTLGALGFAFWAWRKRGDGAKPWWGSVERFDEAAAVEQANAALQAQQGGPQANTVAGNVQNFAQDPFTGAGQTPVAARSAVYPSAASLAPKRSTSGFDPTAQESAQRTAALVAGAKTASGLPEGGADFAPSIPGASRSVNTEELFDIQQQADFFMSLGQHSQAIDILQNHISDSVGTSALAYLDLFDIYHKIGQREDFEILRDEFNRVFNTQVPEFDRYGVTSRGLEDYQPAIQRIQALWPNAKVLAVIEESIFRMPDRDAKPFDLLAYRELMLLYAIAKDLSHHDSVRGELLVDFDIDPFAAESADANNTSPQRLSAADASYGATQVQPLSAMEPQSDLLDTTLVGARSQELIDQLEQMPMVGGAVKPHVDIDVDLFADANDVAPIPMAPATPGGNSIDFEPSSQQRGLRRSNPKA